MSDIDSKLTIIDFWATWCSPCVAMIPWLDSLQQLFKYDIQIISVTYQKEQEVLLFLQKLEKQKARHFQLPVVTGDNELRYLFPHKSLPHYVWISANGTVKAITGMEEITADNIDLFLDGKPIRMPEKKDLSIPYTSGKPMYLNGNGGTPAQLEYYNILSGYKEGLPALSHVERIAHRNTCRITFTNCPVLLLFKHAYGNGYTTFFPSNRVLLEVRHPEELTSKLNKQHFPEWIRKAGHGVCYELKVPAALSGQFYRIMQDNLKLLFPQYTAAVEKRMVKSIALTRLEGADQIKAADTTAKATLTFDSFGFTLKNSTLAMLLHRMQLQYQQTSLLPFIDETGYLGRIDLSIKANLNSIADMNRVLKPYNLEWKEKEVQTEMLVIRDAYPVSAEINAATK